MIKLKESYFKVPVINEETWETKNKEIFVPNSELIHWIDERYSAEEVLDLAKKTLKEAGDEEINQKIKDGEYDLDDAYDTLLDFESYGNIKALRKFRKDITNYIAEIDEEDIDIEETEQEENEEEEITLEEIPELENDIDEE